MQNNEPPSTKPKGFFDRLAAAFHDDAPADREAVRETLREALERGLIERSGKLDVPGRPSLLRTTDVFLRTMGVSSLEELPELPDITSGDGVKKLEDAIEKLSTVGENQLEIEELK